MEKRAASVFQYSNYLPLCQKSVMASEPFLKKLLDGYNKNELYNLFLHEMQPILESCIDWKIPQSACPRAFWAKSQEPEFSQIWNLFQHTAITIIQTFIIDQIKKKLKNWEKKLIFPIHSKNPRVGLFSPLLRQHHMGP